MYLLVFVLICGGPFKGVHAHFIISGMVGARDFYNNPYMQRTPSCVQPVHNSLKDRNHNCREIAREVTRWCFV